MKIQAAQYKKLAFVAIHIITGLQWLLRCPMLIMAFLNKLFEALLQRKLTMLQVNADRYASKQAAKVVSLTQTALAGYHSKIFNAIERAVLEFFDKEAFRVIHFYDLQGSVDVIKQSFDEKELERVYNDIVAQIHSTMSPHANASWERSIFLLKKASKALKMEPHWDILKEKTLICARQIVWEVLEPEINNLVKTLAKERFTRAVLITIVQSVREQETTVSLTEMVDLCQTKSPMQITLKELPIFSSSPIGMTLTQTFNRLWREARLPRNKSLRPVIIIVSDGQPTDSNLVDLPLLADKIKQLGIPIICCFITNTNTARSWVLRRSPGIFWSEAARLMFAMSSGVEEYPQLAERLRGSRFVVKKQAKLFIQPNHSDYLRNFVEAVLLPLQREQRTRKQKG